MEGNDEAFLVEACEIPADTISQKGMALTQTFAFWIECAFLLSPSAAALHFDA